MATSLTRNLKLRLSSDLTVDSKYNLERIDTLASVFSTDSSSTSYVRSQQSIILEPNSADIGGTGLGGNVSIGTASQQLDNINLFSTNLNVTGAYSSSSLISSSAGFGLLDSPYTLTLAPPSLTTDITLILPPDTGTANQVLTTDGVGTLSWSTVGGVSIGQEVSAIWQPSDGTNKTVAHGFGTRQVMVQILDSSDDYVTIQVDRVSRPNDNEIEITSTIAPSANWIILIKEIG